jgi:R3H domain
MRYPRHIPPHLKAAWERGRAKKAELKRVRRLARIKDNRLTTKERKKERKKHKYDLLKAGLIDPENGLPDSRPGLHAIEALIRVFVEDIGGSDSLVLPPMDKQIRANVHKLANAFNLKSKSQGKGNGRFTTLFRTSKTGILIKEWKIEKLVNGTTQRKRIARHKEGDEVGKSAPKIGEGNIGFKLLQQMGFVLKFSSKKSIILICHSGGKRAIALEFLAVWRCR